MKLEIDEKWQWLAMERSGELLFHKNKPFVDGFGWSSEAAWTSTNRVFSIPTDIPWKQSLHRRNEDGTWSRVLPELEVDAKVLVRWRSGKKWTKRHFSHFREDGGIVCFNDGCTSFTAGSAESPWEEWKLPGDGDEA